jgi:hypothetical protein
MGNSMENFMKYFIKNSMEFPRNFMEFHKKSFMKFNGKFFMKKNSQRFMENSMEFHEMSWNFMKFHEIPWEKFHEIS